MTDIQWLHDFEDGHKRAQDEKKPLFLDFFKDGWGGCAKLGAVTYPDDQVAELLNKHFVPVQVDIEKAGQLADRYQALWTPNLNVIDGRGKCVYAVIGWLPPPEFAAMLETGRAHYHLGRKKYVEAEPIFKAVVDKFPRSVYAAECLYFKAVSRYLASHDVEALKEGWTQLQQRYSGSEWAMKSDVF